MTTPHNAPRLCPECSALLEPYPLKGQARTFCSKAHQVKFNNRVKARGQGLVLLAMAWRQDRGSGQVAKDAFAELTRILDLHSADDRANNRPKVKAHVERIMRSGSYIDRARPKAPTRQPPSDAEVQADLEDWLKTPRVSTARG